ncbi:hypothetical protein ABMA28_014640 [Loxostege sticticalis]|uniref:C-type lectin domain-containing protein n=1 Tax=Loxostege sticticalis TaxID=481309 RepID=A0ABD0TBT2_LOXSC
MNIYLFIIASHTFRRDYTFDPELGGWLKYHPMPVEWQDAALRCHYEGAILASPLNEDIRKALTTIMANRAPVSTAIFTGISNTYSRTEYQSMEGVPISNIWLSWAASPKLNPSEENSIVLNVYGTVDVVPSSDPHPFICYRQTPYTELTKCGIEDTGYVLNQETGSCYKLSEQKLNWTNAYQSCAFDGAHLAIINSKAEADTLWNLAHKKSGEPSVLVGIQAWGARRTWLTVHGQSLSKAGYSEWRKGEPNNANGKEACGGIHAGNREEGILNDVECGTELYYICEIETAK